jgi:hypothetical protein
VGEIVAVGDVSPKADVDGTQAETIKVIKTPIKIPSFWFMC